MDERQHFKRPATIRMVIEVRDPADFVAAGLLIERLNVEFPPDVVLTEAKVEAVDPA
jgi:hypothetical protein